MNMEKISANIQTIGHDTRHISAKLFKIVSVVDIMDTPGGCNAARASEWSLCDYT